VHPSARSQQQEAAEFARQVRAMNARIAERRRAAPQGRDVPIPAPRWAERVVDTGNEIVAIHADTTEPYPLEMADLSPEDHATIVVRRVFAAGGKLPELERLIRAFVLPVASRDRLLRQMRQEVRP
jgi:hypothetical protein